MKTDENIIVIGDVHGDWSILNSFLNKYHPKIILQVGDFGYWPRWKENTNRRKWKKKKRIPRVPDGSKLYFCDGNHEDHESLLLLKDNEVYPNCFYMKRGSTLTLPDGRVVLFMGGAMSIDKESRCQGVDWFPEEDLTYSDVFKVMEAETKADIVISHTCPKDFFYLRGMEWHRKMKDWARTGLEYVRQTAEPDLWYCGHFHFYQTGYTLGCRWTVLSCIQYGGKWWEYLRC